MKDDHLNDNYKKVGGRTRSSWENGEVSCERARSSRKVQKVGLRGLVDDEMESVNVDKRKKRVYTGESCVTGDKKNQNSADGKVKGRLGGHDVDVDAKSSSGKLVRRFKKVQVSGLELTSKANKRKSENSDIEMRNLKDKADAIKNFLLS